MRTWLGDRHNQIKLLFFVLMILLGARLFYLTVVQGVGGESGKSQYEDGVYVRAEGRDPRPIRQTAGGQRGELYG